MNCHTAPNISADSSPLDSFRLMITDELVNILLTESNHYYQQCIQGQENKTHQPDISDRNISFSSSDNPDGT